MIKVAHPSGGRHYVLLQQTHALSIKASNLLTFWTVFLVIYWQSQSDQRCELRVNANSPAVFYMVHTQLYNTPPLWI